MERDIEMTLAEKVECGLKFERSKSRSLHYGPKEDEMQRENGGGL